ncbi:MAG: c-type cytochrome [Opitutaceae bacterium]|nr:c-type cytochrome [Opitutaceae bacterium]
MRRLLALAVLALLAVSGFAADWRAIDVPGAWNEATAREVAAAGHTAWYRTWIKVHDSFFTVHERNLYEESVGVNLRDLEGAHEVWVNGVKIGTGGAFPPNYQNGRAAIHRHKVPVGTLRKGEWNEIAIKVHRPAGPGPAGFLGEAPFIMNYFWECIFAGKWEFRAGDDYTPGRALKEKPTPTAFDVFRESNRVLGRAQQVPGPRLAPAESAAQLTVADDLKVELILAEPEIAQPFHFSFDERARLWVTHSRQYPYPAGLTMLSRDKYYRAHYDKVPPAPPNHDRGLDLITIHESTKGDGLYDSHKVFVDGLNMANAAVRGHGGVWIMHTPYLLFYPDKNGDDIPDGPPEVRLAGFGLEDTHSIANGLVWGPDGWLYGGQGSTTSSRVVRPGIDPPNAAGVHFEGCMVWRYHPDTRAYEIFAEGSGNTFGLEFDAEGRLYSGHNGGQTRGWHYVQGGFYLMQGVDPGKFGPPRNPYAFGELPMMATSTPVVRFSHYGAFADGTAIPARYRGMLFALDPLHNVVIMAERSPRGSTFSTADRGPALQSKDPAFRPVYIANAPDGSLYVSDMYDFYVAHGQHYQNQIDINSGRMYRLSGRETPRELDFNLAAKTTPELVVLLAHPNKWHRSTSVRLLGERHDPAAAPLLRQLLARAGGLGALNALWALHQSAGLDEATAITALQHTSAVVRMWTARLLGDEWGLNRNLGAGRHARVAERVQTGNLPAPVYAALLAQAAQEQNAEVLSQFASTARRLNAPQALPLAAKVLGAAESVSDPFIPLLGWWVFEAHIPAANREVLALFANAAVWDEPAVREHLLPRLARRYAVEGRRPDLLILAELFKRAPSPAHAARLMLGLEEAFRGRPMTGLPDELVAGIQAAGQAPLAFRLRQGEAAAVDEAIALIQNAKAPPEERLRYVRTFGEVRALKAVPALLAVAVGNASQDLRKAALVALSAYDDEAIGNRVAELLPSLKGQAQQAAFTMLASRPSWSLRLLETVQSGRIAAAVVPDDVANRLRRHRDTQVSDTAKQVLPRAAEVASDYQRRIQDVSAILKRGAGDPYQGEATFTARCAACHKLFFKGGNVGPDLTTYQRDDLGTMLLSIINPNAEIREGYQYISIETTDGRTLSGFIVERDNQVTVLRSLGGENITLRAAEIRDLQPLGQSLMPTGLLDDLNEQQLRNFFAYLRISQPISR